MLNVPAKPLKPSRNVFGESQFCCALNRDGVVVVDPAEIRKPEVTGDRSSLGSYPLHQIAVAAQHIRFGIEELVTRLIVMGSQPAGGDGHADRVTASLAERASGRLNPGGHVMLWMPRTHASQLTEAFDVVECHSRFMPRCIGCPSTANASQVDERIKQHRCMSAGEHKSVAIWPGWIGGVVPQKIFPDGVGNRGQCHRSAWMAALGRFDRIHRERANRVDRQTIQISGQRRSRRSGDGGGSHESVSPRRAGLKRCVIRVARV